MSKAPVHFELEDGVARVRLDDGKVNVVGHALIEGVHAALDRARSEARAVALLGAPGKFSAGFDLEIIRQGGEATRALVHAGARLMMRLYAHPQPVVAGVSGHALAAGALLALCCDLRVGARGAWKVGLPEVAVNLPLPHFLVALAEERLSRRHLVRATLLAEVYDPDGAVDAGFLDRLTEPDHLDKEVVEEASRLTGYDADVFAASKQRLRAGVVARVLSELDRDDPTA